MIKHIEIQNLRSIEHLEIKAGAVVVVSGGNGEGKSSVLDAIAACFAGGHRPDLIRRGEKKAQVTLTLSSGATITKTITENTSTLKITDPDGKPVSKPQSYVETLASGFGLDPLKFVNADKKERAKFLLAAMPIKFDTEEIAAACGQYEAPGTPLDLDGINALRAEIYDARKQANTRARDAEGTMRAIKAALPADDETNWEAEQLRLAGTLTDMLREVEGAKESAKEIARMSIEAETQRINAEIDRLRADLVVFKDQQRAEEGDCIARVEAATQADIDATKASLAQAQQRAQDAIRAGESRKAMEAARKKMASLNGASDRLTAAIEKLDALKNAKLAEQPVAGLEIRDGEVYYEGLPFDSLNTAAKFVVAFQVGSLGQGGLMIADGAECLESGNWADFLGGAKASGYQVVVSRVTEGPLKVEAAV